MASKVPDPVLDLRNGDEVTAQSIASLPDELSDRSPSNPAVVLCEATGNQFDKLLAQINSWPRAAVQKTLALVGVVLEDAAGATCTQRFTLSSPKSTDTVVASGTEVSTDDGSIVFETTSDLTIAAYTTPAGTVATTSGSATVTGSGTTFQTGSTWEGWQIEIPALSGTWYTISSVSTTTSLTLTSSATATVSGAAWNVGPIVGTVNAQATTTGTSTNVGAGKLTTLVTSVSGVASTTNSTAATGGQDEETASQAVDRAPEAFATREVACAAEDYAAFAQATLGSGARVRARSNYNGTSSAAGYVTVGLLSPTWTTSTTVTAAERGAVVRDLQGRAFTGATLVDSAVVLDLYDGTTAGKLPAVVVYRKGGYAEATVRVNIAAALNTYLNPNNYPWDPDRYTDGYRPVYPTDLVEVIENAEGVDRVETINGVPAVGMNYRTSAASMTFAASTSVTGVGATDYGNATANQTFLIDATNKQAYLVTVKSGGNAFTLDRAWAGTTGAVSSVPFWTCQNTTFASWLVLPYTNLSVSSSSPASSIIVAGVV